MYKRLIINGSVIKGVHLPLIILISTILFSLGYVGASVDYALTHQSLLLWVNVVCFLLIWLIYGLFKFRKVRIEPALLLHIVVVTLNLYFGILYEAYAQEEGSLLHIVECMCICMIPAMLAGITTQKMLLPSLITLGVIACYVIAGVAMGNPENMLMHTPAFFIVIAGFGFSFSLILRLSLTLEQENRQRKEEQKNIAHILDLTPKQWELIKQGRMSRKRMEHILHKMNHRSKEKIIYHAKKIVQSDEEIKQAVREKHPGLSLGDMELCSLIVQGKTVTEIAKLQDIKTHSVTARRSRLRTKLGLEKGENLNDYLVSIARSRV